MYLRSQKGENERRVGSKLTLLRERMRAKVISVMSVRRLLSLDAQNLGSHHESNAEQGRQSWSVGMETT